MSRWTDAFLDSKRLQTDPLADAVAARIVAGGEQSIRSADELFTLLTQNASALPGAMPAYLQEYFEETSELPAWADPKLLEKGEDVFNQHGLWMVTALLCSSLPQCYAGARGAQVLYITGRMVNDFQRRIVETAQFVTDVMAPGGMRAEGRGIATTQKVRLIHAAIRAMLSGKIVWDPAWGKPVNQADLAGTLLSFSIVCMDGVELSGMTLDADEEAAVFHAWRCVGHVLGLPDDMLPDDVADGRELWAATKRREFRGSDAGRALTKALLDFIHHVIPGTIFDGVGDVAVRRFVGDDTADLLGVPPRKGSSELLKILNAVNKFVSREESEDEHVRQLVAAFSERLVRSLQDSWRQGKGVTFEIPPSLRGSWGLEPPGS